MALVAHARHVPVVDRERFATRLRDDVNGTALLLETCHRVEAYISGANAPPGLDASLPAGGRALYGDQAVRHAIAVAVGRDSVVVGEDQVLHQLRESVDAARANRSLDPTLERLFGLALRAGRRARSWRQGPARSLGDVAVAMIERQVGPLDRRQVLIVGAGKMGRLAVRAAGAAGASVSIANRSSARAHAIAAETGSGIEVFDAGPTINRFAAVIVALAGSWPISSDTVDALAAGSTVVVDLSVPDAVPRALVPKLGDRLISADTLAQTTEEPAAVDDRSLAQLDGLIDSTAAEFHAWLEARDARAAAAAITAIAERERQDELVELWRRLPDLDATARDAIERMSQHLARRLLREPLDRLGHDADGRHERAARELFGL
jgi:glutamyl-tRNA reductase